LKYTQNQKYSEYCDAHGEEFSYELRNEASQYMTSWPLRLGAILMAVSSIATYLDAAVERNNPYASYTLLAYSLPIVFIVTYPVISLAFSTLEKYSPLILDSIFLFTLAGYCFTLYIIFSGATSEEALVALYPSLLGQVNIIILLTSTFSFHAKYIITLIRNICFTMLVGIGLFLVNYEFAILNQVQLIQGFFTGAIMSWIFFNTLRARFYLKSTDADTRQHLYNQLSKLVYPHQLERIKLGDELENTMPLKEGKAVINVFDVQRSSDIKHERAAEFFVDLFQAFLQICMKGYEHNPLRSQAFRLKETGDGFISTVGYPFLPVDSHSLADSAVATALEMFDAFNAEVERFNYSRPIKGAMGLAYNSVQGTFQSGGIRSYDLFGESLIQATRYEELRKQPVIWRIIQDAARERGLEYFNIIIAQEVVYNSLSPYYRDMFIEIDLRDSSLVGDFRVMYDNDARYIYFHLLD